MEMYTITSEVITFLDLDWSYVRIDVVVGEWDECTVDGILHYC